MIESIENIRGGNYKDIIILTGTLGKEDKELLIFFVLAEKLPEFGIFTSGKAPHSSTRYIAQGLLALFAMHAT
jgi:hypothetical protein